jgi:hypothetical protein
MVRTGVIVVRNLSMTALPSKRMPWPRCAHAIGPRPNVLPKLTMPSRGWPVLGRTASGTAGSGWTRAVTTRMGNHSSERLRGQEHG